MSAEVDVVNLALSHLGDVSTVSTISPPDGSMQAEYAARFYPQARDSLLEMHDWIFATTFSSLAALVNTSANWSYAYALPANYIKIIGVAPTTLTNTDYHETVMEEIEAFGRPAWLESLSLGFKVGNGIVYANEADAVFAYTYRVTDTTKFSPLFVRLLARLLASDLAGPILKGEPGQRMAIQQLKIFQAMFGQASTIDSNVQRTRTPVYPSWISAR